MNRIYQLSLILIVVSISAMLFFLLLNNSYSYLDPDLGWHLKVGEDILKSGDAPRTNDYNFTLLGERWVDHEWLMEVLMYSIFHYFSYFCLHLFFVFLVIITFYLLVWSIIKKYGCLKGILASLPFLVFGIYTSLPHFGLRPQEFALFFTVLLLIIINKFEKNKNFKYLLFLIPLFFFWANLHGSFLLGLGLLLVWYLIKIIFKNKYLNRFINNLTISVGRGLTKKESGSFLIVFLLIIIATLFNPYGLDLYLSLTEYSNTYYLSRIAEWLSQFHYPYLYPQLIYLSVSFSLVLLYIIEPVKERGKIKIWSLFLFLFLFILAFKSRRHFPLFVIASFSFLVDIILYYYRQFSKLKLKKIFIVINFFIIIIISTVLAYCFYKNINWHKDPFNHFCRSYPCEAVKFLKENKDLKELKLFNNYNWGGYMIWTYPDRLLFIDGRLPHYPYKGRSMLEEYNDIRRAKEIDMLEIKLEKHDISLVLIESKLKELNFKNWEKRIFTFNEDEIKAEDKLKNYLDNSLDWENIYEDKTAIIFKKIN